MQIELVKDMTSLLEIFLKHKDGYEEASNTTDDRELKAVLNKISDYKVMSTLHIKTFLKNYAAQLKCSIDIDSITQKRNLSKIIHSFFGNNDNKFIIEACLIRESSLQEELKLLLDKNYIDFKFNMILENNISQCLSIKSLLWEQSSRF